MSRKSFKIKSSLAAALDDTVTSAKNNAGELHIEIVPLRKISLDPDNPRDLAFTFEDAQTGVYDNDLHVKRKKSEEESLKSLAKSIKEQGVINPIVVYKEGDQYRLIAGERRTLASIMANKTDIPAKVLTAKPDPLKLSLLQWIENIEREDLSLWERMQNLEKIVTSYADKNQKAFKEITPTELASILGCSLQQAVNYRHVLNASKELRDRIKSGVIKNIEKAALIAKSPKNMQPILIKNCIEGASLSALKRISANPQIIENKPSTKTKQNEKVNFGSTTNLAAAKNIIHAVLGHDSFKHFGEKMDKVIWDDHRSVSTAFRKLLKLLEQA